VLTLNPCLFLDSTHRAAQAPAFSLIVSLSGVFANPETRPQTRLRLLSGSPVYNQWTFVLEYPSSLLIFSNFVCIFPRRPPRCSHLRFFVRKAAIRTDTHLQLLSLASRSLSFSFRLLLIFIYLRFPLGDHFLIQCSRLFFGSNSEQSAVPYRGNHTWNTYVPHPRRGYRIAIRNGGRP
jgi:hypothetical protein